MGGRGVGEEDDGGGDRLRRIRVIGEVVFSPSIEKRCLGFRSREKLVRQFYRGEELLPFEIPETVFGLASREGGEGSSFSSVLVLPSFQPPRGELTCPGGKRRRRRRRFGFVGARRQIHVQLLLPAEFMGCLRWLRKLAASINSFPAALRFLGLGEIYFLRRFFSFLPLFIRINDWFNFLGSRGLHP